MPETTGPQSSADPVGDRVRAAAPGLVALLAEAEEARRLRVEAAGADGGSAVCAWNHFENIPTFYNWNNRPR
ncbi:multiple cyclophane-containing RiPP AmcA [Rhizomonospora bruguierae]|uniref:multiple cyclophane-containing RiPP AmcA n=1 Tax=Rhizomonospora bruguierae TaxID=1581705 RepID=UPI001BD093FC|nr:multiple cyclophane-containing RiPP AmcA [Micromonospora sp. NBRC 107566]